MRILVLGSAAGGGVPQWNCNAPISRGVREGRLVSSANNQASIALSADGVRWVLVNASPDLRQQINLRQALWPREGRRRDSPIEAVLLTGAEIDNVAGLLTMRERQAFAIWSTARVLEMLAENPIFDALDGALVARRALRLGETTPIAGPTGETGITATAFAVPGKVPLYLEKRAGGDLTGAAEGSIGLELSDGSRRMHYIPGCAKLTDEIRRRIAGSAVLFFDGTLWTDDEMIAAGVGQKTGQRMGHMSMAGPDGSIAQLDGLGIDRKIFIHINNTNPALLPESAARAELEKAGWEVAADGMEIEL